jgi:hypothetical protein
VPTHQDRREHVRIDKVVEFFCYVDGQRFDSASVNVSAGGAFLATEDPVRDSAALVVIPKAGPDAHYPVALVGTIRRREIEKGKKGLGIQWLRIISRAGVTALVQFASANPELVGVRFPAPTGEAASSNLIGYSFETRRYFRPDVGDGGPEGAGDPPGKRASGGARGAAVPRAMAPAAAVSEPSKEAPEQKAEKRPIVLPGGTTGQFSTDMLQERLAKDKVFVPKPQPPGAAATPPVGEARPESAAPHKLGEEASQAILSPLDLHKSGESGPVTTFLRREMIPVKVNLSVTYSVAGLRVEGRILQISLNNLFIACKDEEVLKAAANNRVEVRLSIPLHRELVPVKLSCSLVVVGTMPETDVKGMSLRVIAVTQCPSPGLYERYVKYLYYHSLVEPK